MRTCLDPKYAYIEPSVWHNYHASAGEAEAGTSGAHWPASLDELECQVE